MIFNPNFKLKNKKIFLLEVDQCIADQLKKDKKINIHPKIKNSKILSYIKTKKETFIIRKNQLSNDLMICQKKENNLKKKTEIENITNFLLFTEKIKPDINLLKKLLDSKNCEEIEKGKFLEKKDILENIIISEKELEDFIQANNGILKNGKVIFLNKKELIQIFHQFLGYLKINIINIDELNLEDLKLKKICAKFNPDIIDLIFLNFFTKKNDNLFFLEIDILLKTVIKDLFYSNDIYFYDEFLDAIFNGIKELLSLKKFQKCFEKNFYEIFFLKKIEKIILEVGVLLDYNNYANIDNNYFSSKNVKVKKFDYTFFSNFKERLVKLKELKNIFSEGEIKIYFADLFENEKAMKKFIKKNFKKIVLRIDNQFEKEYRFNHPLQEEIIIKRSNQKNEEIHLLKMKNLWLD